MNTKALRQKVLDLAIHGKLVPQNPNDESATVLLEKIRAEKAEKIKKGELKADKKDSFIFVGSDKRHYEQFADGTVKDIEDEIPFEVPDGWAWCRLGELFYHTTGKALKKSNNKGSLRKYITTSNLYWNKFDFTEVREMYFTDDELDKCTIKKGDLVLCNGGDVGRAAIWNYNEDICYQNHVSRLRPKIEGINNSLYLYLLMFYKEQGMLNGKGVGITSLSANDLLSAIFPLPPLNEQNSIVTSIENIFEQIEHLDQEKSDLQTIIKQTKSKILDLAIHGKLVPQDPNDEPAEELLKRIATSDNRPYKKIDEDEALFDIPESWSWCTLGEIYTHTTGKALKKTNNKGTLRKYITTSNLYWNSFDFTEVREMYFTDDELEKCTIKKGDLILCNGGDVGRAAIWNYDYDICYQNHVSRLRPKNKNINNSFFLYVIMIYKQQGILNGKGVGIISLSASDLLSAVVPLPPYSEQNRIVEKIECLYGNLTIINNQL
ncbi:restriction endonuclease subunit S [Treponema succinifaciens]|uniref:Restriction modification system DNA specificity domain protein n=1 Tax=Treponema succinifaciens (strain ATCC 33096 / DSM 2489 / 6091) TaxID=869209 RepID=F2NXE8_TRES6|nr:restriction endonuclease subunit S [Treponema succinifaciens]AEB14027.1 restriction modification system DNA specificity domain protein [Treponema succinifaciens DSM 2489]